MVGLLLTMTSYLLGGFLPALYVGSRSGQSIRTVGSGNPGARNAGRVFGKRAFCIVLILDAAKGALPVLAAGWLGYSLPIQLLVLTAVMLGHCYPLFHRFRGGKGAASFAGGVLAADPRLVVPILVLFTVLYWLFRETTAPAVLAAAAIVPACLLLHGTLTGAVSLLPVLLLLSAHRGDLRVNLKRRQTG